ncbi:MAG: FAD-binding oxidoreductase [Bacteroidales bacterium]|nr:FAD-binding oxidoreductase [Bacteroidales bacterium]
MEQKYLNFKSEISSFIPGDRIYTDELRRYAWGTDAGFYRLVPQIVVRAANEGEVSAILSAASRFKTPVTFRAAGTSLSGQAVSDSILIVAGKHWEKWAVEDNGDKIRLQPGVIGSKVNDYLKPYNRKFGPDPASIKSAMVGGIVMNNASGMSCGTVANSDRMLIDGRIVFVDGSVLDTSDQDSREAFVRSHQDFIRQIEILRDDIRADQDLSERIRHKYSIKNVTGLNLLPFLLYDDPIEIILHLLVGSEGTLAFISEVTMKTLPQAPLEADSMVYFQDMAEAARAVIALKNQNVSAVEMLDKRSLASVNAGDIEGLTALLIQTEAQNQHELADNVKAITDVLSSFDTYGKVSFTTDPEEYGKYWAIRSGIFPTVGGMRRPGTTCLIEDVAFHIEDLAEAVTDLSDLLERHGYDDSCIYGHALEGNFHFIINQSFDSDAEVDRYKAMIHEVGELVVKKYDGSLKAEHGTGRNMAPFVEYEWGTSAYQAMKRIKEIFDPENLLNPGVIFNDDPECCFKNFKALPMLKPGEGAPEEMQPAFVKLNKCIECGFCEVNCVSCGFTLSSRTRIVLQREIARLSASGEDPQLLATLKKQYSYFGDQTCAGDGLCSMSCPMGINVGDLTHEVRRQKMGKSARKIGEFAADNFHGVKTALRGVLHVADFGHSLLGSKVMGSLARGLHAVGLPLWTPAMPKAYNATANVKSESGNKDKVVYFPSCLNQMMGVEKASSGLKPLAEEMTEILNKAGFEVIYPDDMDSLCCGTIWESKGIPDIAQKKIAQLEEALWKASEEGKYPVVCDQSPCLHRMRQHISKVRLYEAAEFIWKFAKDRLQFTPTDTPVALHLTCSTKLMKIDRIVYDLACLCSTSVLVPEGVGCCGFAGDKGMTHPELNAYALRKLAGQIKEKGIETGYSNSRTCEIGLQTNSGIPYRSIIYLVNSCTSVK